MHIRWLTAFLDFPREQFGPEVTFWRAIAGSTVSPPRGHNREFASLEPFNGDPHLRVQRIESDEGGVHLDFAVDDVAEGVAEAVSLGATPVDDESDGFQTMRSPGGFVFCIDAWGGEYQRSRPIRWPGDSISIIDQVSIDVPAQLFDAEVAFWSTLTGRDTERTSRPELVRLTRDPALAIGILVQRLGSDDDATTVRGHLDIAASTVDDEVVRHEDWGARVVHRFPNWTVMADPVGRLYCITGRNPRTGD